MMVRVPVSLTSMGSLIITSANLMSWKVIGQMFSC